MSSDYFVLNLINVPAELEDWVTGEAFAAGALGVSEVLAFSQPEGEEDVFTMASSELSLDVYFAKEPSVEWLQSLRARMPALQWKVRGEATRDWLEEWKKGFKPFCLTGTHWVVPSWCEAPVEAQQKIWVDPGMAFGTGTHETTQLCAEEMHRLMASHSTASVLDVGTGTGILAVLARQLGASQVVATELEADSRRVARENFLINSHPEIMLDERQVENLHESFDLVVANIIDGVLVRIQSMLLNRVKPGGWLVVSGIIIEREPDFLAGFKLPEGKAWDLRVQKGDWLMFSVKL